MKFLKQSLKLNNGNDKYLDKFKANEIKSVKKNN